MSCEVPRISGTNAAAPASGQAATALMAANPDDVNTLDAIIAASYDALSGPVGSPRQWERYRSLLDPQARLVSASMDATTGLPKIVRILIGDAAQLARKHSRAIATRHVRSGFAGLQTLRPP